MNETPNPETPNPETPPETVEPQHVVDVLRYCVRQYAIANDMTTEDMVSITIEDLVTFCDFNNYPQKDKDVICEHTYDGTGQQPKGSRISSQAIDVVQEQLGNPYAAVKLLFPIWPWIVEKRPPLGQQPVMMELTLAIAFDNETAVQIAIPTKFNGKPMSNGFIASLIYDQALSLVNTIGVQGLDAIRKEYGQPMRRQPPPSDQPEGESQIWTPG